MSDINITDTPTRNYDTMINFCRYVDGRAKFIRVKTGDNADVYDFCRKKCKEKCGVDFPAEDDGSMVEEICYNCSGIDCLVYLLYTVAVQAAELREHIKNLKSDNAAPVRHGHWEDLDEEGCYCCSACDNPWIIIDGTPQDNDMNFCPNCGAKMDEESEKNA